MRACPGDLVSRLSVHEFVRRGGDLNLHMERVTVNKTPLASVTSRGDVHLVETLIELKADINAFSFNACTALHVASEHGHYSMVERLIDLKADPNTGSSCLVKPVRRIDVKMVQLLIDARANLSIPYPLLMETSDERMIATLLANRAPLTDLSPAGESLMRWAHPLVLMAARHVVIPETGDHLYVQKAFGERLIDLVDAVCVVRDLSELVLDYVSPLLRDVRKVSDEQACEYAMALSSENTWEEALPLCLNRFGSGKLLS